MFTDVKRKFLIYFFVISLGAVYLYEKWNENAIEDQISIIETGTTWSEKDYKAEMETIQAAYQEAAGLLALDRFSDAALRLYHAYPRFENYLNVHGFRELDDGQTLAEWYDTIEPVMISEIETAYERMKTGLAGGDVSLQDMETFMSHTPFKLGNMGKRRYRQISSEIETTRLENAPGWFIVYVGGSMGNSEPWEELVRGALQRKWVDGFPYKLVLGGAMNSREERAAACYMNISLKAETVTYAFADQSDSNPGSDKVPERITVTFTVENRSEQMPPNSWDNLEPISVYHQAPETLSFVFKNKNQSADLSGVVERQNRALETELIKALDKLPYIFTL